MAFPEVERTETQWTINSNSVMRSQNITIMDGTVVRYYVGRTGEISAGRDGVMIHCGMPRISKAEDIQTLHEVIDAAWVDAKRLTRDDRFGGQVDPR